MEVRRTFDIVDQLVEKYKRDDALAVKRFGKWETFSTDQYKEFVDNFSYGLLEMGFNKGDKIATVSNNRPEWNFIDMGMGQVGAVHVPIYPTIGPAEYEHVISHSDARIMILSSKELYDRILPISQKSKNIEKVYTFDEIEGIPNWMEIINLGKKNADKHREALIKRKDKIDPMDLFSIIYTSGTTGLSKGVMLSHNNFITNVLATKDILPLDHDEKTLSFLPLCHVLERMVNYLFQYNGNSVYYAESIETLGENLKEVHPAGFVCVPRVIEKLYDKIIMKGKELSGIKKTLFFWAVDLGLKYELNNANGAFYNLKLKIADKLIFSKWREALGGNAKVIVSGGAALQPRLARVFHAAKVKVQEGYGLTETSPVISVNHVEYPNLKFGSVGPIIEKVQVKIADDGEILMKGPNLMMGYYKDPQKTSEVIDEDGWFHTGDIGELDDRNILTITDRKKEMFKLSTGKYIAPQVVENKFKESSFIEQIMVVGADEKFAAAIICPSFEYLHDWCSIHNIKYRDNKDLIQIPKVIERFQQEVDRINQILGRHEQLKKFELTCQEWLPETGELSPTLKVKRRFLKEKYKIKLDRLYGKTDELGLVGIPSA
ncbi:MAG: long-chain fatty acid--CoA ligase [Bacteroidales bacterium]|nr:long-chain fatty acid--CoA ligase [Bacteroidales bacterium]MBN2757207.1 long-chain fatty acid--CoA ligase [Bacteroidales bacterium]